MYNGNKSKNEKSPSFFLFGYKVIWVKSTVIFRAVLNQFDWVLVMLNLANPWSNWKVSAIDTEHWCPEKYSQN